MMDSLPHFVDINEVLEEAVGEVKVVFGHNDLLAAKFYRRRQATVASRLGLCRF